MPKDQVAAQPAAEAEAENEVTLAEFCTVLSQSDRRVELLGAFHFSEKQAGRMKDTSTAYKARFDEFLNKPTA